MPDGLSPHANMTIAESNALWAELRTNCPIAWVDDYGGYWIAAKYADVRRILRDHETFSSARLGDGTRSAAVIPGPKMPFLLPPEEFDPPLVRPYRDILSRALSPTATGAMQPAVDKWVTHYFDQMVENAEQNGRCDLVIDFVERVAGAVVLEWLGFPDDDWKRFYDTVHHSIHVETLAPDDPQRAKAATDSEALLRRIREIVIDRRCSPRDDVISYIAAQEVDGELIDVDLACGMVVLCVFGGVNGTTTVTSMALYHLHRDRALRSRLLQQPELIDSALEEFLRVYSPVRGAARTVTKDVEVGGLRMRPGERVVTSPYSACQDDEEFGNASTFDPERFPNRHAAFGLGIHRCPGSHLARAEVKTMIKHVLRHIPDYTIDDGRVVEYSAGLAKPLGYKNLPATLAPQPTP